MQSTCHKYLTCQVNEYSFAFTFERVYKVLDLQDFLITKIPFLGEEYLGVIYDRGHVIPLLDISYYYQLTNEKLSNLDDFKVLIIQNNNDLLGIPVSEVADIKNISNLVETIVDVLPFENNSAKYMRQNEYAFGNNNTNNVVLPYFKPKTEII